VNIEREKKKHCFDLQANFLFICKKNFIDPEKKSLHFDLKNKR